LTVGGVRIIDRVARALRAVTSELVVISNDPDAEHWLAGVAVRRDLRPERGSLVGLHTALSLAADSVFVVAWDMPFVNAALTRLVHDRARDAGFAAVPEGPPTARDREAAQPRLEPLCAVYTRACLPLVERALDEGDWPLWRMIERLPSIVRIPLGEVASAGDPARLFFNVNTPEDLSAAEHMEREG
jgi:molybdopterin-guanine dinucleotide biosynthesis protein A